MRSAVDFGCGLGTWLSVLQEQGVDEIQGLDGAWVNEALLEIPKEAFREVDFEGETIDCGRRYDLAISLEVAEHISESSAARFIGSLTAASDFVLFSAAIPLQGGRGHVNEQWPDYWAELFGQRGFVPCDLVRGMIWNDSRIPVWYRQNTLLFVRQEQVHRIRGGEVGSFPATPLSVVHPDSYLSRVSSLEGSWGTFLKMLRKRARGLLKRWGLG